MTALRPTISLPTHAAVELLVGVLALAAPFALGFGLAGAVASVLVGVCTIGLALDAAEQPTRVSAHQAFDYGIAFAAVAVAVPLALAGDALLGASVLKLPPPIKQHHIDTSLLPGNGPLRRVVSF